MSGYIKNLDSLATNKLRKDALLIAESAYKAIDTKEVIKKNLSIKDRMLSVGGNDFKLDSFERIFVLGFGKASCQAVQAIEEVLDGYITGGVVIDKNPGVCKVVKVYQGAHPLPSQKNVEISDMVASLSKDAGENDLVIVVVSGGGSSLLCWPASECDQGNDLYNKFLNSGGSIDELNIVRKHISLVKGGGLAKMLYPATVVSLIFSDVPGDRFDAVASGPSYFDNTTAEDASRILKKYSIDESFTFNETPKDRKFFEKVYNIPVVSNTHAIDAMSKCAEELGYKPIIVGHEIFSNSEDVIDLFKSKSQENTVVIGGGEVSLQVRKGIKGIGGRNEYIGAIAIKKIDDKELFLSFASDGIDNLSECAGVIIDKEVKSKIVENKIDLKYYIEADKEDEMFKLIGNQVITGPTGSNVSDLMILIHE